MAKWQRNRLNTVESDGGTFANGEMETDTQDIVCFLGNIPRDVYHPLEIR